MDIMVFEVFFSFLGYEFFLEGMLEIIVFYKGILRIVFVWIILF